MLPGEANVGTGSLTQFEDQLAAQMPAFADAMGVRRLVERIGGDLRRAHRAGGKQFGNPLEMFAVAANLGPQRLNVVARRFRGLATGSNEGRAAARLSPSL